MIRISIITVTYNAAAGLRRTLDSVSAQSYPCIEHLIIDGASTDGTLQMAKRYQAESHYEVSVQSEPDDGLYDAMNKGLQLATGDFVVFLNAGDALYAPDTIDTVVRCADDRTGIVYGDTAVVDSEGRFLRMRHHRPPEQLTWFSFSKGMLVCHQAFYARRDIACQFPYKLRYRYSADVDWCIRVMKEVDACGYTLVNTHATLANFEYGGNTTQHHFASLWERFRVMAYHYGYLLTIIQHVRFVWRALTNRKS